MKHSNILIATAFIGATVPFVSAIPMQSSSQSHGSSSPQAHASTSTPVSTSEGNIRGGFQPKASMPGTYPGTSKSTQGEDEDDDYNYRNWGSRRGGGSFSWSSSSRPSSSGFPAGHSSGQGRRDWKQEFDRDLRSRIARPETVTTSFFDGSIRHENPRIIQGPPDGRRITHVLGRNARIDGNRVTYPDDDSEEEGGAASGSNVQSGTGSRTVMTGSMYFDGPVTFRNINGRMEIIQGEEYSRWDPRRYIWG